MLIHALFDKIVLGNGDIIDEDETDHEIIRDI